MASRILHYAVVQNIMQQVLIADDNRFRLGVMLPDAYRIGVPKADSHFKIFVCGNSRKTYDLENFRARFGELLLKDDLYLGYYLHLIQDLIFRQMVYEDYNWNPMIPGYVDKLHSDYHLIGQSVIRKYHLSPNVKMINAFEQEEITKVYPFDAERLLEDFKADFKSAVEGEIFFFTEAMADEFIHRATKICIEEIEALRAGQSSFDAYTYAWRNQAKSLLKTTGNTRDLGGYRTSSGKRTKSNSIIRSDIQNYPSEEDFEFLRTHGITTVIDMRGKKDVTRKPSGFADVDDISYYNFPIIEGSGVPESVEAVAPEYMKIAQAKHIGDVFRCISHAQGGVMYNCTAGKDRTGVMSAILLSHVGVSDKDIIENYILTKEYGAERLRLIHQNFPQLDMEIVTPNKTYMVEFLRLFREKFGDTCNYFKQIGLSQDEIQGITKKLVE